MTTPNEMADFLEEFALKQFQEWRITGSTYRRLESTANMLRDMADRLGYGNGDSPQT